VTEPGAEVEYAAAPVEITDPAALVDEPEEFAEAADDFADLGPDDFGAGAGDEFGAIPPPPRKTKSKTSRSVKGEPVSIPRPLIIGGAAVGAVILLCGGIGAWWVFSGGDDAQGRPATPSIADEEQFSGVEWTDGEWVVVDAPVGGAAPAEAHQADLTMPGPVRVEINAGSDQDSLTRAQYVAQHLSGKGIPIGPGGLVLRGHCGVRDSGDQLNEGMWKIVVPEVVVAWTLIDATGQELWRGTSTEIWLDRESRYEVARKTEGLAITETTVTISYDFPGDPREDIIAEILSRQGNPRGVDGAVAVLTGGSGFPGVPEEIGRVLVELEQDPMSPERQQATKAVLEEYERQHGDLPLTGLRHIKESMGRTDIGETYVRQMLESAREWGQRMEDDRAEAQE
jgi:hypothetical protein